MIPAHFLQDEGRLRGGYWQPVRRPTVSLAAAGLRGASSRAGSAVIRVPASALDQGIVSSPIDEG